MSTTNNPTDGEINTALARAMGYTWRTWNSHRESFMVRPDGKFDGPFGRVACDDGEPSDEKPAGTRYIGGCPDYFAPAGSAELEDWLLSHGYPVAVESYDLHAEVVIQPHGRRPPVAKLVEVAEGHSHSAARRRALALAAFAAIGKREDGR